MTIGLFSAGLTSPPSYRFQWFTIAIEKSGEARSKCNFGAALALVDALFSRSSAEMPGPSAAEQRCSNWPLS